MRLRLPRKRWLLAGVIAIAVIALAVVLARPEPLGERARRIQLGMTADEVERILGAPPGNHGSGSNEGLRGHPAGGRHLWWGWDDGTVDVTFDSTGRAIGVTFQPDPDPPSLPVRLRARLPW